MTPAAAAVRHADLDIAAWASAAAAEAQHGLAHPEIDQDGRDYLTARAQRMQAIAKSLRDRHETDSAPKAPKPLAGRGARAAAWL